MKGVEEFECIAVAVILKFIRNLVACSMNHYPGVSHRTFGFRTLSNDLRHEFDTLTPPLNQIEQTKNIRIEKNQMFSLNVSRKTSGTRLECFIFERVRLSRSSNEVELFTEKHEWNKIVQLIKRWNSQGDLKFCFFPTVEPLYKGPVLSGQFSKSRFLLTQTLYLLPVLGGHLY